MGRFVHFRFPKKIQPAFIKNKEKKNVAFYVPAHYCLPRRIVKPLAKKYLRQDYSLRAILLIMSSARGRFVFVLFAPETVKCAASFLENQICHLSKLFPQPWKNKTPRGLLFPGHIDASVVDAEPGLLPLWFTPWRRKASLLTTAKS